MSAYSLIVNSIIVNWNGRVTQSLTHNIENSYRDLVINGDIRELLHNFFSKWVYTTIKCGIYSNRNIVAKTLNNKGDSSESSESNY